MMMTSRYLCIRVGNLSYITYFSTAIYRLWLCMNGSRTRTSILWSVSCRLARWRPCRQGQRNYSQRLKSLKKCKWTLQWLLMMEQLLIRATKILQQNKTSRHPHRQKTLPNKRQRMPKQKKYLRLKRSILRPVFMFMNAGIACVQWWCIKKNV